MRSLTASTAILLVAMLAACIPWTPAGAAAHSTTPNWNQRDCATYVVSTLNLLHFRNGRPITSALTHKLMVTHYDVYADQQTADLYFIEPRRDDGSSVGAFAYHMGWLLPMSVSSSLDKLHVRRAPSGIYSAYRSDSRQLIGTFTSTLPS